MKIICWEHIYPLGNNNKMQLIIKTNESQPEQKVRIHRTLCHSYYFFDQINVYHHNFHQVGDIRTTVNIQKISLGI